MTETTLTAAPSRISIAARGALISSLLPSRYNWAVFFQVTIKTSKSLMITDIRDINDTVAEMLIKTGYFDDSAPTTTQECHSGTLTDN